MEIIDTSGAISAILYGKSQCIGTEVPTTGEEGINEPRETFDTNHLRSLSIWNIAFLKDTYSTRIFYWQELYGLHRLHSSF